MKTDIGDKKITRIVDSGIQESRIDPSMGNMGNYEPLNCNQKKIN